MRNSIYALCVLWCAFDGFNSRADQPRELVIDPNAKNRLLVVGVPGGLPGIDKDLKMVTEIGTHPAYQFVPTQLWSGQGTVSNVSQNLTRLASETEEFGTLFFYFSGHGSGGRIALRDRSMRISEIRAALEKGREALGPMSRLVLMFDSCYSGSLLDPVRKFLGPIHEQAESEALADAVFQEIQAQDRDSAYWKSLFVFASSRANETSNAGSAGSSFTVALKKAFGEVINTQGTLNDWVSKTKLFTKGHHPVERFSPLDVANEKLIP